MADFKKKKNNNNTIVYKISDNMKEEIMEHYTPMFRDKKPPYSVFQADDGAGTVITLYESGKLMFQGISADLDYSYWREREKFLNSRDIDSELKKEQEKKDKKKEELNDPRFRNVSTIGSDEVGTGDYFGPIVVVASYVSKENIPFVLGLEIKDSKKITDKKVRELAPKLMQKIPYKYVMLSAESYNKSSDNMNKIKAKMHNKALLEMQKLNLEKSYVVVDQFCEPLIYFRYLSNDKDVFKGITFTPRAESKCLSVAASSIIARYIFLKEFEKIGKELNKTIPKGAGLLVDDFTSELVKEIGFDALKKYVKLNFKNTDKIKK